MTDQGIYYIATAFGAVGVAWAIAFAAYHLFKNN
jgi:hypothetical protein